MSEKNENPSPGQSSVGSQSPVTSHLSNKSKGWKTPEKNACFHRQFYRCRDIRNLKAIKTLTEIEKITKIPDCHRRVHQGSLKPCKAFSKSEMDKIMVKKRAGNFFKQSYVVNNCWQSSGSEIPMKLVGPLEDSNPEDDSTVPEKKQKLEKEGEKSPPYTKEFHFLSEVQKSRILQAVEEVIKKVATEDYSQAPMDDEERPTSVISYRTSVERLFCKKFLLPWMAMKAVEMVLCQIIQFLFIAENSCFLKKGEFLPIVVAYYLTIFIIFFSLVIHIGSFSYAGIQNPCYLMGVISSSILTLTTTFGIIVMLTSMEYYKAFLQILVLLFLGILLCLLFGELLLCYVEVKNMWNKVGHFEQFYIT